MTDNKYRHAFSPGVIAILLVTCVLAILVQWQSQGLGTELAAEHGPFEIASALAFACGFLLALFQFFRQRTALRLSAAVMLLWALLRELDFQKRFTYRSIESVGYYTRPDAPLSHKVVALLVLLPFAIAGFYLLLHFLRRVGPAFRNREVWVGHVIAAIVLLVVSGIFEKALQWETAEEVCESGFALILFLLVWHLRVCPRPGV